MKMRHLHENCHRMSSYGSEKEKREQRAESKEGGDKQWQAIYRRNRKMETYNKGEQMINEGKL